MTSEVALKGIRGVEKAEGQKVSKCKEGVQHVQRWEYSMYKDDQWSSNLHIQTNHFGVLLKMQIAGPHSQILVLLV